MLIQFALTLTVLLGFCGLALDVGYMELIKLKLQNAADAAALGAAYAGAPLTSAQQAGRADASLNGFTHNVDGATVAINTPPISGPYAGRSLAYEAVLTQTVEPFFFAGEQTATAHAVALGSPAACVWLLGNPASGSYNLDTSTSSTIQTTCPVYLNSNYNFQQASLSGAQLYVGGSPGQSVNAPAPSPPAIFNSPTQADPLSYLQPPTAGACESSPPNGSVNATPATLYPGTYCNGISINSNARVTFQPGVYVVYGNVTINGGSSATGSGVCFYLTKNASSTYGSFTVSASQVNLSAPISGLLEGILVFTDRNITPKGGQRIVFVSTYAGSTLDGILYAPGQQITASTSTLKSSSGGYFGIVADSFTFNTTSVSFASGYSTLAGGSPFHSTDSLVQ